MIAEKIKTLMDRDFDSYCGDCFSAWITCLWGKYDKSFTFEENKDAFFYLIDRLLNEGKIKFGDVGDQYWNATPKDMVEHLKKGFPHDASHENDLKITSYFYDDWDRCPPISWLGKDGQWHGS